MSFSQKPVTEKDPWQRLTKPLKLFQLTAICNMALVLLVFLGLKLAGQTFGLGLYYIQGVGLGLLYILSLTPVLKSPAWMMALSIARIALFGWVIVALGHGMPYPVLLVFLGCFSYKGVIVLYASCVMLGQAFASKS